MQVINYYKLSDEELDSKIQKIRDWLFDHHKDERAKTAEFALDIALNAKELREGGIDDFTQLVIDTLT